jgi:DNA-binding NarL/FixJ family response regulator
MLNAKTSAVTKKSAKILIVDDHPMVREGLLARIARQPDLEVCGEAIDVAGALEQVKATSPDLVVVDISLKGGNGIDLIKRIKARNDGTRMLVSSMYEEGLYAERALRAGAMGYINKQEMPEKVIHAIRRVLGGKMYLSPQMTDHMVRRAVGGAGDADSSPTDSLSDREIEIFGMIGRGRTTREIAGELHLSVKTVETHRENIKAKLGIKNSAELGRQAVQWVLENG